MMCNSFSEVSKVILFQNHLGVGGWAGGAPPPAASVVRLNNFPSVLRPPASVVFAVTSMWNSTIPLHCISWNQAIWRILKGKQR